MSSNIEENLVNISEIFYSIQGEGVYTGEPTIFVRFQGCSLGCTWCDTKYTWDHSKDNLWTTEEIVSKLRRYSSHLKSLPMICITGGEPLEQPKQFDKLVHKFSKLEYDIEVETSGLVSIPFELNDYIDSWVVDLKLPSAKANRSPIYTDIPLLRPQDQLKCVVKDELDMETVHKVLEEYDCQGTVLISPWNPIKGTSNTDWIEKCVEFCKSRSYRLSLQSHKFIWGAKRGV